jgi:serine/threonine protein kinase
MQPATGGYVQLETLVSKHSWQIKADEIELVKRLAEGTYGVVWDGRWKDRRVAIKVLKIGGVDSEGDQLDVGADEDFERECAALEKIDHSHLLKFYGVGHLASTRAGFIVTELLALGSLRQVLQDRSHDLPWHVRTSIACQLARGMEALHGMQPPMIHRDLKVTCALSQCPPMISLSENMISCPRVSLSHVLLCTPDSTSQHSRLGPTVGQRPLGHRSTSSTPICGKDCGFREQSAIPATPAHHCLLFIYRHCSGHGGS